MSAFRWAQTANFGVLPNALMPNCFVSQAYDLNDPWAHAKGICSTNSSLRDSCTWTNNNTAPPSPCCQCGETLANKTACDWNVSLWNDDLRPLAPLIRTSSETPFFMGPIHPRLKAPVGRRLAAPLITLAYGGTGTVTGPTISGCALDDTSNTITLRFNKSLLAGDSVAITRTQVPIPPPPAPDPEERHPPKWTGPTPVQDSSLLQVCTGNAIDCACLSWTYNGTDKHHPSGFICEISADGNGLRRPPQATRGDIWSEAPIKLQSGESITVDTSHLNTSTGGVRAVKFGWSFSAGSCCVDLASQQSGLCIPGSCGVMTKQSLLPLNPFFATIDSTNGKCKCPAPQECDE
eukprot:COSAG02_NODE_10709_length_1877_cov_1.098988_1_plen_349_part_00